ncbi:hypothetical protein BASA81_000151 [Batrachochytrium salamandrivorans]|nr:hypothetical protein BASA81_000151 [Batrachochytrium salamandrivorans]
MASGLVLLEHVNFKVPYLTGEAEIRSFFVQALGCPECPPGRLKVCNDSDANSLLLLPNGTDKQMHVNLGAHSQIHFEFCTCLGQPYLVAQQFLGSITLEVLDLEKIAANLTGINHPFRMNNQQQLVVQDPFGMTTWMLVQAKPTPPPPKCIRPGGVGNVLTLKRVEVWCDFDPALAIEFYSTRFGAKTDLGSVYTQYNQELAFVHSSIGLKPHNSSKFAIHLCLYVSDFANVCRKLEPVFWVNPDYVGPPINDRVQTAQEAIARKQFRIRRIGRGMTLEHEIRAIDHPLSPFPQPSSLLLSSL